MEPTKPLWLGQEVEGAFEEEQRAPSSLAETRETLTGKDITTG